MRLSWETIQSNAVAFSKRWKNIAGRERQQAQTFIREFLAIFGVEDPLQNGDGEFEYVIKNNYIDYLWRKQIAIEMKGKGKDDDLKRAFIQTREKYMPFLSDDEFPEAQVYYSDSWTGYIDVIYPGEQRKRQIKHIYGRGDKRGFMALYTDFSEKK